MTPLVLASGLCACRLSSEADRPGPGATDAATATDAAIRSDAPVDRVLILPLDRGPPPPRCGDGTVDSTVGEQCDDGNTTAADGCSPTCQVEAAWLCPAPGARCRPVCGDGIIAGDETCDDGNTIAGDGCSTSCHVEGGDAGAPVCGDGVATGPEECDLGAANDDAAYGGCTTSCRFGAYCGDGIIEAPEVCDLGARNGGPGPDGCALDCRSAAYCGDGIVQPGEQCDFGSGNGQPASPCTRNCLFILAEIAHRPVPPRR